jgi:polyphosphate kinase
VTDELAQRTTESSGPAGEGGATITPEAARTGASEPDLSDPSLYFNRELSWLDFNDRVLQLAEDPRIPLLERVNFAAIYEDNLDEFFMVRVAGLHDQVEQKIDARGADQMSAADVIELIRQRTIDLRTRLCRCFAEEIRPALAEHGIRLISLDDANAKEREEVEHLFTSQVFPALTPLVIGRGRPFPYISNMSLSIGVLLRNPEKDEEVAARVKVPKELLRRFLSIGDGLTFVPLEDVIKANLDDLFPGMEIVHNSLFRVTRDTD